MPDNHEHDKSHFEMTFDIERWACISQLKLADRLEHISNAFFEWTEHIPAWLPTKDFNNYDENQKLLTPHPCNYMMLSPWVICIHDVLLELEAKGQAALAMRVKRYMDELEGIASDLDEMYRDPANIDGAKEHTLIHLAREQANLLHDTFIAIRRLLPQEEDTKSNSTNTANPCDLSLPSIVLAPFVKANNVEGAAPIDATKIEQATDDGGPFYKPSYFTKWNISDEILRRNSIDANVYIPGKVRRQPAVSNATIHNVKVKRTKRNRSGKGHPRPTYWYSESDARKRWPDKFAKD
jgi:hypothetical protein